MKKKILMRSGCTPWDGFTAGYCLKKDFLGTNSGNLLYAYSLFRNLTTKNVEIVSNYYELPKDADYVNETYDGFIIPLADAFRTDYVRILKQMTDLINKLKIPVYVIGVGIRAPYEPKLNEGFPFDNEVRNFVKAVLKRSNIVGVRGEITAQYLNRLGFKEGVDHEVIGCPSMYSFGRSLKIRELNISKDSLICTNYSDTTPKNTLDFLQNLHNFYNTCFIPQNTSELKIMYAGKSWKNNKSVNKYPLNLSNYEYISGNSKFFVNVPMWVKYMKTASLSIGTRLHGNIVAVLAGTPSIMIPKDARMRELASVHDFTRILPDEISPDSNLDEIISNVDFHSVEKKHHKNFDNFIDFLNKINIDHIYNYDDKITIFDELMKDVNQPKPLRPITVCNPEEIARRLVEFDKINGEKDKKK